MSDDARAEEDAAGRADDAPAQSCLDRTADRIDFGPPTPEEAARDAERRVSPLRRLLRGLVRPR